MSFDVQKALDEAARPGENRPFRQTTHEILAMGRRRRRRRTMAAAGGTSAVAALTVGALVLGVSALGGGPDRSTPPAAQQSEDSPGRYETVRVSEKEAVRRCGLQMENSGLFYDLVGDGDDWRQVPYDWSEQHRWRVYPMSKRIDPNWRDRLVVGGTLDMEVRIEGHWQGGDGDCEIPEAGLAAESGRIQGDPVAADDTEGILRQCGEIAGYDFTGWEVVSAMGALDGVQAMLQSTNDHAASCTIESPDKAYIGPDVGIFAMSDAEITRGFQKDSTVLPYCVQLESQGTYQIKGKERYRGEAVYSGSGNLYRPNGTLATNIAKLRFDLPDGTTVTQQVSDAKWAVRFAYQTPAGGPIPVTMLNANGTVVHQRNAMKMRC